MMSYKKGDKFIIEIDDIVGKQYGHELYSIKGFNTLVFDGVGLDKLEKYEDKDKCKNEIKRLYVGHYYKNRNYNNIKCKVRAVVFDRDGITPYSYACNFLTHDGDNHLDIIYQDYIDNWIEINPYPLYG